MAVPLLAFIESCIGIGLFVSGIFLVIVSSIIHVNQWASLPLMWLLALLGAALGDHVGYYTGRWIGPGVHHLALARRHRDKLRKAEALVRRHGSSAIFIGRFIPAIRSLIPAMLGISDFDRLRYSVLDGCACLIWSLALIGIVIGAGHLFAA